MRVLTVGDLPTEKGTTNTLSLGASMKMTDDITFSAAWVHGFRNSISGPVGQIPGASTTIDTQTDSIIAGLNIKFGGKRKTLPKADGDLDGPGAVAVQ